ncbi:MAG: hypothetical protein ACK4R6_07725 [Spirosomataceae bacterium]
MNKKWSFLMGCMFIISFSFAQNRVEPNRESEQILGTYSSAHQAKFGKLFTNAMGWVVLTDKKMYFNSHGFPVNFQSHQATIALENVKCVTKGKGKRIIIEQKEGKKDLFIVHNKKDIATLQAGIESLLVAN